MALTPAAQRLKDHLTAFNMASYFSEDEINALAAVVLNVSEIEADTPTEVLARVLKAEFPLIAAPDKLWESASASMIAKLESLGFVVVRLSYQSPQKEK